ncbi:MAG: arginase [Crocinitomicaceae bacterium]|nr:arginase [Crocinitomicaceae bacterium]|tara:strand:+ start:4162 stop:5328 length:1167 start_codon:yes stop_codon:yes gene_type:complete
MDEIGIYLSPVADFLEDSYESYQLGSKIKAYREELPELGNAKLAIIGVMEDRGAHRNDGCSYGADRIRQFLYELSEGESFPDIVDVGNIRPGATIEDTFHAFSKTIEFLIKKNVIPVILGGSQDLTFANYLAYQNLESIVNLVSIDARFDLGEKLEAPLNSRTYLSKILTHQPNFLFNYTNIGYQTYFVSQEVLDLMDKLYFDSMRLGLVRSNMQEVEPKIRNADIVSFDLGAIKASDAPGNKNATPNGLTSDECCQITRYAGLSDKLSSIGFYEYNPEFDPYGNTAHLVAQMIWYFIEGVKGRKNDVPSDAEPNYLKYRVTLDGDENELLFYKSVVTDRWWMNVPFPVSKGNRFRRHEMVPCSYKQYQEACNNEMPELWLKTYQKML